MWQRSRGRFLDQVRGAIKSSGMSRYFLAQQSGVDEAAISRFVHGAGLSMESLDSIAEVLGLVVTVRGDRSTSAQQTIETKPGSQ